MQRNFTMTIRGQTVTVSAPQGDVCLTADGQRLDWQLTDNEWFDILEKGQSLGYETDDWAYSI